MLTKLFILKKKIIQKTNFFKRKSNFDKQLVYHKREINFDLKFFYPGKLHLNIAVCCGSHNCLHCILFSCSILIHVQWHPCTDEHTLNNSMVPAVRFFSHQTLLKRKENLLYLQNLLNKKMWKLNQQKQVCMSMANLKETHIKNLCCRNV